MVQTAACKLQVSPRIRGPLLERHIAVEFIYFSNIASFRQVTGQMQTGNDDGDRDWYDDAKIPSRYAS